MAHRRGPPRPGRGLRGSSGSPVVGEARGEFFGCDGGGGRACAGRCPADSAEAPGRLGEVDTVTHWRALMVLGTAQFLLDTSVMNVSISQLVDDFDTEVTVIQAVIMLYALVMAAFMMIGGKF